MPTSNQNFIVVTKASKNKFSIEIFLKRVQIFFSMSSSRSENETKRNETDKNRRNIFFDRCRKITKKNIFLATSSISRLCQKLVTFAKNAKSGKFSQNPIMPYLLLNLRPAKIGTQGPGSYISNGL